MEMAGSRIDVLVRWREHAREWARRHLPGMAESRIDPDFNPNDGEFERGFRAGAQMRPPAYNNGGDDSSDLKKWIVGVGIILSGAFIIGGWSISNQMAAQTVKIDYVVDAIKQQNERITRLERANDRR